MHDVECVEWDLCLTDLQARASGGGIIIELSKKFHETTVFLGSCTDPLSDVYCINACSGVQPSVLIDSLE